MILLRAAGRQPVALMAQSVDTSGGGDVTTQETKAGRRGSMYSHPVDSVPSADST